MAGEGAAGASCRGFDLLFSIMIAASATAFFCASRASRVLSATILPAATRFGFFAGRVVGVGEGHLLCDVSCLGLSCWGLRLLLFGRHCVNAIDALKFN